MRPAKPGVEVRAASLRICFQYRGQRHRERVCINGHALLPTPTNVKYARRLAAEIGEKIASGNFNYGDYFPDSQVLQTDENTAPSPSPVPLLFEVFDMWLKVADLKASTRDQYATRINSFWKQRLANVPVNEVRHSDILEALAAGPWRSAKSRNNELSMIRGPFNMALHDQYIVTNPCDGIAWKDVQRPVPDPFTQDEVHAILEHLAAHRSPQVHDFVQFMFYTGLRTSEGIGLRWKNVDLRKREILIEGGNVHDEDTDTTKTSRARIVLLTAPAFEALQRMKERTFDAGDHVFTDPKTQAPWRYQTITDARSFWKTTLSELGIRYRRPYNTRHTYATLGIMSGVRPAFIANQLGHSLQVFFQVYARWINSADDRIEIEKLDRALAETRKNRDS